MRRPLGLRVLLAAMAAGCGPSAPPERPPDAPERTFDPPPMTLYLVRHAETAETDAAGGEDPGLSAEGQVRAEALADTLARVRITDVYASQYRRAQATVQPLADTLGLEVTVRPLDNTGPRGSAAAVARQIVEDDFPYRVVVAGHSNTIPAMVEALTGEPMDDLPHEAYGDLFVVTVTVPADGGPPYNVGLERRRFGTPAAAEAPR